MVKQAAAENSDHGVMLGCGKNCLLLENGDFLGFPKHNQGQIFGTKKILEARPCEHCEKL